LLVDRDFREEGEPGIVRRGVDDHRIAGRLDVLLVEQGGQGLERIDQGVERRIPIGAALEDHHRLGRQRDLLAEGIGGLNRRGDRRRGGGLGGGRRRRRGGRARGWRGGWRRRRRRARRRGG